MNEYRKCAPGNRVKSSDEEYHDGQEPYLLGFYLLFHLIPKSSNDQRPPSAVKLKSVN